MLYFRRDFKYLFQFALSCICSAIFLLLPIISNATEFSSSSFEVHDPVIDGGTGNTSSTSFKLNQSINQPAIGKSNSTSFQLWGGFQYYYTVLPNVLTANAGSSQVNLSWTVPQTFLGINVSSYEVGTGTSSGIYTFESVGNVTSFAKTGLTNGTPYYFKIKALASGGEFLVFSNESTATPTGTTPPPSGGAGGGYSYGSIELSGFAQPRSEVHALVNANKVANTMTKEDGTFKLTVPRLNQGINEITLYYTDTLNRNSSWYTHKAEIVQNSTETLGNIVLPPTITVSPQIISLGKTVAVDGAAPAGSSISITITNGRQSKLVYTTANEAGLWSTTVPTGELSKDTFIITANATKNSIISNGSLPAHLWIDVTPSLPPYAGIGKCGDYNNDGRINIIDFSILIFWFGQANPPPHIDCNRDNKADLIDFSILMYYWTG